MNEFSIGQMLPNQTLESDVIGNQDDIKNNYLSIDNTESILSQLEKLVFPDGDTSD